MSSWSDLAMGTAQGAASSAAGAVLGAAFAPLTNKIAWKYAKKEAALEDKYAQKAFQRETDRQDYLIDNQYSLMKRSLQNAGYSTADPTGAGVSAASSPSSSAADVNFQPVGQSSVVDPISAFAQLSNARLMSSNAKLNEIEAKYRARKLEGEIGVLNMNIQQVKDTLPLTVENLKKEIDVKVSQKEINEKQAMVAGKSLDQMEQVIQGLKIDNKYKDDLRRNEVNKLEKEVYILSKQGKIKEVESKLADYGILVGAGDLANLFSVCVSGKSMDIAASLSSMISQLSAELPELVAKTIVAIVRGSAEGTFAAGNTWFENIKTRYFTPISDLLPKDSVPPMKEGVKWERIH